MATHEILLVLFLGIFLGGGRIIILIIRIHEILVLVIGEALVHVAVEHGAGVGENEFL